MKADQAAVDSARLQLSYTRVTAPIAGRVGLKQVDLGNVVQPTDANGIVVITQTRPIAMVFAVPAANVPLITTRLRANEPIAGRGVGPRRQRRDWRWAGWPRSTTRSTPPPTPSRSRRCFPNADDALFPNQAVSVMPAARHADRRARRAAGGGAARLAGLLRLRGQRRQHGQHAGGQARCGRRQLDGGGRRICKPATWW